MDRAGLNLPDDLAVAGIGLAPWPTDADLAVTIECRPPA